MLIIDNIQLNRGGKRVLHGVHLQVKPGSITALLGANGVGKSSTVLAIGGLLPITSGQILADQQVLHNQRPEWVRKQGVSVVPEGHQVLGSLTVRDNLQAAATQMSSRDADAALETVLGIFPELTPKLHVLSRSLSGGQKQMVCLAQALITSPKYLVVDELSLGLAPAIVQRLSIVLKQIAAQGVGVLLIEQFTSLALGLATDAFVMSHGKIAFSGTSEQLLADPKILERAYLGD